MSRLLKAFFYKISKDLAFRITLIVGVSIALLLSIILLMVDLFFEIPYPEGVRLLTGHGMLTMSLSPAQNYGIAIPINVVIFVVLEFTQGTIRNKIIAGHSKFKIYASLYISGLILAAMLLLAYVGFLTLFGTIAGGFDVNTPTILGSGLGSATVEYIVKFTILGLLSYTMLVSFAVFIATSLRAMGPSIPLIFVVVLVLFGLAMLVSLISEINQGIMDGYRAELEGAKLMGDSEQIAELEKNIADLKPTCDAFSVIENVAKCIDPFYGLSVAETTVVGEGESAKAVASMDNLTFYGGIASNLAYSAAFFVGGACLFKKRDVK